MIFLEIFQQFKTVLQAYLFNLLSYRFTLCLFFPALTLRALTVIIVASVVILLIIVGQRRTVVIIAVLVIAASSVLPFRSVASVVRLVTLLISVRFGHVRVV